VRGGTTTDRGQLLPFMAVVMVLAVGAMVALAAFAGAAHDRELAVSGAAVVARAGALGGEAAADAAARVNGVDLVQYGYRDGVVTVTVRRNRSRATARAERVVGPADAWAPPGVGDEASRSPRLSARAR